jgi:hypothetical protein
MPKNKNTMLDRESVSPVTGIMNIGKTNMVEKNLVSDASDDLTHGVLDSGNKCAFSGTGGTMIAQTPKNRIPGVSKLMFRSMKYMGLMAKNMVTLRYQLMAVIPG